MSGRTMKLGLLAVAVVVLGLAIGLVQLTRSAPAVPPPPVKASGPTAIAEAPAREPPPPAAPPVVARERHQVAPILPRAHIGMQAKRPELAPAQPGFSRDLKRDADGKLVPMISLNDLRELVHATDAPMQACIERSGKQLTGNATLSFTVVASHDKLAIETTGTEDEQTLAGQPALLECMHQTARLIALDGRPVPELGTAIYVRRHVRLEAGALAENSIANFSYNP